MTDDAQSLLIKIGDELRLRNWKLAVAESITGGRIQSLLTSQSGSSDYFAGGLTAYDLEQKTELLGVDRETAAACDCVSEQTCFEMATGVMGLFDVNAALATTGYAEPYPAQQIERPLAYIAVGLGESVLVEKIDLEGARNTVQDAVAVTALLLFWQQLESCGSD
jgi:nicotinamide-nucleotide amidase